jgi:phenylacetate-CoA ligase
MNDAEGERDLPQAFESWPSARIEAWQLERLREVVDAARRTVPYYRALWERSGVGTAAIKRIDDIRRFPLVTKQDLVRAGGSWSTPGEGRVGFSTRGTSGEPLVVWLGREEEEVYLRPTIRGFRWAGFKAGMTALLMSPVWHRLAACEAHAIARLGGRCAFFWGSMGTQYIESFMRTLGELRPEFVTTTAPMLLSIARQPGASQAAVAQAFGSVRSISVVGLPLTPKLREYIRDRVGADDVFERAGTQEGAALDECAHHGAPHVHEDVCYLEVVDADGNPATPGARGKLIVTKLNAAGCIFVRYNTGDTAAFISEPCPCGRTMRRLKIYGRPESSVEIAARTVTAYDVRLCLEEVPGMVGRNMLLVRDGERPAEALVVAVEGRAPAGADLERLLCERLEVPAATIMWLGEVRLGWGFREVIDRRELGRPGPDVRTRSGT